MFGFVRNSELQKVRDENSALSDRLKQTQEKAKLTSRELEQSRIRIQTLEFEAKRKIIFEEQYLKSLHTDIGKIELEISKKSQILKLINALLNVSVSKSRMEQQIELDALALEFQRKKEQLVKELKCLKEDIVTSEKRISTVNAEIIQKSEELKNLTDNLEIADVIGSVTSISTVIPELTSIDIKNKLDALSNKRRDMLGKGIAWNAYEHYYLNNSLTAGKAQQKRLAKFLITAFDAQVDNLIAFSNKFAFQKTHSKIESWFEKVNKLGRDHSVVIEREYLKIRLEELKLAFEFFIRKKYEKEEERYINESIREEKKVQKEIEEFVKKREREAADYQADIERITKELRESSEAEAEKLKEAINDLKLKLALANAEKERAISLAQLTRSGHVYIISNEKSFGKGIYKIGMTRRLDPMDRVKELGNASVPFFFDVHGIISSDDAPTLERELHRRFDNKRVNKQNYRREFFEVSLEEIQAVISEIHGTVTLESICIDVEDYEFIQDED